MYHDLTYSASDLLTPIIRSTVIYGIEYYQLLSYYLETRYMASLITNHNYIYQISYWAKNTMYLSKDPRTRYILVQSSFINHELQTTHHSFQRAKFLAKYIIELWLFVQNIIFLTKCRNQIDMFFVIKLWRLNKRLVIRADVTSCVIYVYLYIYNYIYI